MAATASFTAIATLAHDAQSKSSGVTLWAVIVAVSVILGIPGGVITIFALFNSYKQRKVDREIIELAKSNIGAKEAEKKKIETEQDLQQLKRVRDDLSRQIARLPEEANRLFLEKQLEALTRNISRDVKEYESIKSRLQSAATTSTLDPQIMKIVKGSVLPAQKERERRVGYILLILILLLVLNLSPIHPGDYVWRYFNILSDSPDWTSDSPAWMISFGSVAVAVLLWCAHSLLPKFQIYIARLRWATLTVTSAGLLTVITILGYNFRDDVASASCAPDSCGYPTVPFSLAGISFNLAPILGGLFLFILFKLQLKMLTAFARSHGRRAA